MRIGGHRATQPATRQRRSLLGSHRQQAPLNKKVEIRNNADLQAFLRDPIGIITQKTFEARGTPSQPFNPKEYTITKHVPWKS